MSTATAHELDVSTDESLPYTLSLDLHVRDPDVIRELWRKAEGSEREEYALAALRLGTLALRQARGEIDADAIRREGERLLGDVERALGEHRSHIDRKLTVTLQEYFDPSNGRFNERIDRLIKKDGELECLLTQQLTAEDSKMSRTLSHHLGQDSPLFKLLSPNESEGLLKSLRNEVDQSLQDQRSRILQEFSLDNNDGALCKVIHQLHESNGKFTDGVQKKIDEMLRQFSFDDEQSAISRMRKTVDSTSEAISKHFTLDDKDSALSRLKSEMMEVLNGYAKQTQEFHQEVRVTLETMQARRQEAARSTTHGHDFEADVTELVGREAQRQGDVSIETGRTTGLIKNCKKGDAVIELGPDHAAAGAKIVVEAKEDSSFDLSRALAELDEARRNRGAETGLFVFSAKTAPPGLEPLARYGDDVIVVWDAEDPSSDVFARAGVSVAKALCTRKAAERANLSLDFSVIDKSILDVQTQIRLLDEIRPWADTIKNNAGKILDRLRISSEKLAKQAELLVESVGELKQHLADSID